MSAGKGQGRRKLPLNQLNQLPLCSRQLRLCSRSSPPVSSATIAGRGEDRRKRSLNPRNLSRKVCLRFPETSRHAGKGDQAQPLL